MRDFIKRMAVIGKIAQEASTIGHTALMKYLYLLQELKGVPLGYRFQLYLYGPYTTEVLDDLGTAVLWNIVDEQVQIHRDAYGYSYRISPKEGYDSLPKEARQFAEQYSEAIQWVVETFHGFNSAELELLTTLIWIIRNMDIKDRDNLVRIAEELKPHFSSEKISDMIDKIADLDILQEGRVQRVAQ